MKKSNILILTLSILLVVFLSSFIGLSIGKEYANEHYSVNYREETDSRLGVILKIHYWGCGENDCKYCNGKSISESLPYQNEYAEQFVYYRTISGFCTAALVCMIVTACGLALALVIKYWPAIKRISEERQD